MRTCQDQSMSPEASQEASPQPTGVDRSRQTVSTKDGRTLCFAEWGDPTGVPIFTLHGTPGGRLNRHPNPARYAEAGARVIAYDRAGYGRSSRHPGRVVV